ncbi:transcriptional regulator family: Zinc finger CCHC-type [Penicillium paradoxum]|uniref:transcriptional regulator family: Zinc finger CCHC-type n=1 Tax=Penicillium paradoxum TaxID=176176 RepID=UPI0025488F0C|nr:transcriptional regulator family: Zinc finger CCHC-type [Penicillium paradoxum]KAJ5779660.1 transcriptional regulator family: Zinc finger CCHC-type [Penicillium paradoxum]
MSGEWGHLKAAGDENPRSRNRGMTISDANIHDGHDGHDDDFTCGNCGEPGHMNHQCPNVAAPLRSHDTNVQEGYHHHSEDNGGGGERFGGDDRTCYNCGQPGHNKADCTEPRKMGACFNCGEEGHSKAECPKPRVFKGTCRLCEKEGHPAIDCPERPPDVCKNCLAQGHKTIECTGNRKFDLNFVADKLPHEAWAAMKKASDERDLDDFREVYMIYTYVASFELWLTSLQTLKIYSKAVPHATWADIENKMRDDGFNIYIIAMEAEVDDVMSLIDLQGVLDRQFSIGFFFSPKASRAHLRERWPSSPEENLERMNNAGIPYERRIPKCTNCGQLGHIARSCKEERQDNNDRVEIKCSNCDQVGHRVRDCTQRRRYKKGCRNCGSEDHIAAECPEPRSAAGVECRRCNETGHFAKDCPNAPNRPPRACRNCGSEDHLARNCDKPRDVSTVTCRNCDQTGHYSRDCDQPKNWSKVQCNNCGEMGHTVRRCPQPPKQEEREDDAHHSPGSPKRDESELLDPKTKEEPFEYKRQDDNDLW